ncbi:Ig-like domain repeat protein [Alteromonas mediterranea]|uniref:BapA/Bap/LapF family large adhesin n=1 Tax=Alteromonas mediterranea TaxID=314275 RepID=UPI0011311AFA|nr:BapA/Bap/LapF family large adhesin [Alteromonas mediterranea]QDG37652.1 Ig-like domain repeat protein [Alteromonas mediterranea]
MAEVSIVEVNGEASLVRSETGEQINAVSGMAVNEGDVLNISPDATVTVSVNGELRTLPAGQTVSFPLQLDFTDSNTDDEFAVFDESVDELATLLDGVEGTESASQENGDFLDVLAGEGDILESLEATAAGLDGGAGTGGGSNFVRVDRINEDVDPVGFQFEQNNNNNDDITPTEFSGTGEQAQDISLTLDPIGLTNDTTPTITGITSAIPGSTVTFTVTDSEGNTQTLAAIVQDDGTFSVDVPNALADGDFTVDATVLEPTGNTADGSTTGQIDATAPTITINAPGSDNDTTPTLSGTTDATPGSTVTLTITDSAGNTQTVTAIVQADGTYSADVPAELAEGEFTVNASVTDEAGNTATADTTGVIDTTEPAITINAPGSDNDTTPTLTGTTDATPGSTVTLTITDSAGNTQTVTAIVQADGTYSADVPAELAEGEFTVNASVTDEAGNTATADTTGVIDTTEPAITINAPGSDNDTTPTLTGTTDATPGSTVTLTITDSAGNTQTVTAIVQADGTYSADVPAELAEGEFTVNASVTDEAGNTATADTTGVIDTTAPTITINAPGSDNDTTPTLTGTTDAVPGSTVTLTITDSAGNTQTVTAVVQADGTYSAVVPAELAEGEFTVNASVTDEAGNTATADTTGEIDTTAPAITINAPDSDNDTTPTLTGTTDATPGSTVTLTITDSAGNTQTVAAIVQADGTYSVDVPAELAEGEFTVNASVTDEAGNTATADTTGEIDTTAPSITIDTVATGNDTTPTLTGTTDATPGTTVTLTITDSAGNTQTVAAIVQADGTYSVDVPAELAEGEFTVNASVTDEAGNTATTDTTGEIDTTAPSITIDTIATGNDTTPTLTGTTDATPGTTVTLTITDSAGNTQTVAAIVQADGTYSVDVPAEMVEGEFTVNASVTDDAGNTASTETQGTIDVTAPTISLNDPGINGDATPTLSGLTDAVPGSTITLTVTDSAGVTQTFTTTVAADGTFSVEVPDAVAEGTYNVTAEVTDGAGNTAQAETSGDYDSTSPSTTVNQPAPTNDTTPNVSGETDAPPGSEVIIVVTDSEGNEQTITTTVGADGTFNEDVPAELSEGEYTVDVTVTTPAGNSSTTTVTGEVDTTAPIISLDPIGSTNDEKPVINGDTDAEPGSVVTLDIVHSDGSTQSITAIVQEDGSFSAEVPQALANGNFTVTATVSDVAGNTSSTTIDAVINTEGPTVVIETGSPTNGSEGIGGSSDAPNAEVVVVITDSNGNSQTITGTTDENGNFNVDFPAGSEEGEYEIEVTVTDSDGNSSTVSATTVLDTTPPIITVDPQTTGNDTTPTISGSSDLPEGSEVVITIVDSQGNEQALTATIDENGNFAVDVEVALPEGDYEVTVEATDEAGNTTTVTENGGNIDTTAPTLSINPQTDGNDTTPTISGSTDLAPGSTVSVVVTDSAGNTQTLEAVVDNDGNFNVDVTIPLTEGEYTVEASATDDASNTTTVTENGGNIDTQAPTIALDPLGTGNDATPTVSGSTDLEAGSTVTLTVTDSAGNSQTFTATVDANGEFTADVPDALADGDYTVEATVTDVADNSASASQSGTVDSNAPSLTLNALGDDNDTTPTISGTTDLPAGSTVTLAVTDALGNTQTFTATVDGSGNFSVDVPNPLAEGEYSVTATATDASGNTATATETGGNIDITSPLVNLDAQGSTNDATPTISGNTDQAPGSAVSIAVTDSAGNTQTFEAIVANDGTFSVDVPADLADGNFTVTATVTDDAGNQDTASTQGNIDTAAPSLTLDPLDVSNDATPTLSGTTDLPQGSTVTIVVTDSLGNQQTFETTVDENGNFSAEVPSALAEGDYSVTATATDENGNTASTTETGGSIDTTAPSLALDPIGSGNDATPTLSGSSDLAEGSVVSLTIVDSAGNAQTINTLVDANGNFTVEVPQALADGDFTVTATAQDEAGNEASANKTGNINTNAPALTIDAQGETNDSTPALSGTTSLPEGSTVTLTVTDNAGNTQTIEATVGADGTFNAEVTTPLADGPYTVTATATDGDGNTTTVSDNGGTIDTTAPSLTLDNPGSTGDTTPTLSGTTDLPEGSTVTLVVTDSAGNSQTVNALVDANGNFSVDVPNALEDGDFTVSATATDSAGNTAIVDTTGNVDSEAPLLTLDAQGSTSDETPTISGTTDVAPGTLVTITVVDANGNSQSFQAAVQNDGTFSADVPSALSEGDFTVSATVTDAQGNSATANETGGNVDTQAPVISINPLDSGNDTTPTISGSTDLPEGAIVVITVTDSNGDTQTINALVDADGNFATDVLSPLPEGDYTVDVTATDEAGNTTTETEAGGNIDTTAPVLNLDPQGTGNDATPTVSGNTDLAPGSTIAITVTDSAGNSQTFNATVDINGNFSADVPNDMVDGSYTVTVSATDDAGNTTSTTDTGTLDTSAPSLTLDAQGTISDATPTISGTTDLPTGATVTLTVTDSEGNVQSFTALVDGNGNFTADVPASLAEGEYTVSATATDENGNSATVSDNNGAVDTVAPVISLDALGSDNDTTPTITGSTDLAQGEVVSISVTDSAGNTQTFTTLVDANGNFTVDVPGALAEGDYDVTATATDEAGNSAAANETGTIDTTAPSLTLTPQGEGNDTTPTLTGTTDLPEGSVVTLFVTDSTGNIQTLNATVDASGNFSIDVTDPLPEGGYTVEATATDEAGNSTTINDNTGVIDTTAPELTLDELTPENNTTPAITGTADLPAGSIITLTVTDSAGNTQTFAATVQTDGSFSANVPAPLAEGDYTVTATAQDTAGNEGSDTENGGSVDTTAPLITLDPQGISNDNTPTISGSTDLIAGSTVSITVTDSTGSQQTFTATVDTNGDFSADVPAPVADGNFDVTATATDAAGNTATDTISGEINSAAPSLSLDPLASGNDTTPTISGTTDLAPGSTVSITVTDSAGNTQSFNATVQPGGSFSVDVPVALPEGDYTVTATATDGAGNTATVTENGGSIDTTDPVLTIDAQGLTNDATPTISGTTDLSPGDTVSISVTDSGGNTQTFTATVQGDGTYTADVPADLAEGAYSVSVSATDDAGNSATVADNNGNVDTAAPALTIDAQNITNDATPTISGTTDLAPGDTVSISVTDSEGNTQSFTATVQAGGGYSADVPADLAEGDYLVEVTATDNAGNQTIITDGNGIVDTTPPAISLDPVASGNDNTPLLSGTTDLPEGTSVTLVVTDAGGNVQTLTATVNADGAFSVEVPDALADGNYSVDVSATDAAGNSTTVSDSGNINTNAPTITLDTLGQTNDATPLISGNTNAPVGSTVTITVTDSAGAVQTFTAAVQNDGSFSASVPSDLAEGSYIVQAEVTDADGNTGSDSETGGVIDTTSPTVDVADPGIGNDATPLITGVTDQPQGSTVSITVTDSAGNAQTLSATVQSDGTFSVEVPATLADGNYTVEATVIDGAGNTASDTETGVIDTLSPVVTLDEIDSVNDATPTITGTSNLPEGSTVQLTVVDSAGNTQVFSAIVAAGGIFSVDVPAAMAEGSFTVSVTATDDAGNSATDNEAGIIDTVSPLLTVDVADTTNDTTPLITGTTDEPAGSVVTVTVTDSAGDVQTLSAIVQSDGTFSIAPGTALAEGDVTVTATISDNAGNTASASDTGVIDTTAPSLTITPLEEGNDTTPTLSGTTNLPEGSDVILVVTDNAGNAQTITATVDANGNFTVDVPSPLAEGPYSVEATATDEANNSTTAVDNTGIIDTTAPVLSIDTLAPDGDTTPTISGNTDLPEGATVTITVTDNAGVSQTFDATVQIDGSFSADVPNAMAEGGYTVTAVALDPAGNQSTATETNGSVDTTAPTITLDAQGTGNDTTPTITGSTDLSPGSSVTITVTDSAGAQQTFTAIVDSVGNFSADVPNAMADGNFDVTANATDAAGNSASDTTSGTINTAVPNLTLDALGTGNDTTPTISGTTDIAPGSTVSISVTDNAGNTQTFDAIVQANGTFTVDVPAALSEGNYSVTATATDGAGNTATANENGGIIDTTAPTAPTVDAGNGTEITGTAEAGATVNVDVDGDGTPDFTVVADGDGNWSVTPDTPLADGVVVSATATDDAGNTSAPASDTVDAIAPVAAINDLTTNDTTPALTGTVDDDTATVVVTIDGNDYTATYNGNGTWTLADDTVAALAEGSYTATVTATDPDGNVSTNTGTVVIDTTAPTAPTVDAGNGTEITGTAEAGATVNVDVDGDGTPDFTVVADGDGNWSVTPDTPLADGIVVTATATDDAGNTSAPASDTVDAVSPVVTINDLTTNDTTPTLTGTVDDPNATIVVTIDGVDYTATNNGDGSWTLADDAVAALAGGSYTATVTATDADGNVGSNSGIIVIDTTPPAIPTVDAGNGTEITGTAEAGATVNVDVDGDGTPDFTVVADGDGNWSITPDTPLADGVIVTVTATDAAGNISNPASDTVDAAAPVVAFNDLTTNDTTPALTGSVDDPTATVVVTINGADYTATNNGDGTWTLADDAVAALSEGSYTATVTATDPEGNVSTNTGTVVIDTTAPTVAINDLTTNDTTPELTGTVNDPNAIVVVTIDGSEYTATNNGNGTWTLADDVVATLAEGSYPTSVSATDAAGNTVTNSGTVVIDTTAPTVAINDLTTNDTTPELTGTVNDPNAVVVVTIDGNDYTATNNGNGTWTLADDVVATLAEGSYSTSVTATDDAGNTDTDTGTVVIDTTAPTVAINDLTTNDTTPELTGTVNDPNAIVVVTIDGNDYTATNNGNGTWTLADDVVATLAEGSYSTSVSATDAAGNTVTNSGTVVIDTTAPTVTINDLTTNDTTPELTGTVNDPNAVVVVTIDGNDYTATNNGDGTWTLADDVVATLAEGSYPTSVSATDAAGNTVTNTGTVIIDVTAPTVAINDLTTNDTTPELSGSIDDPNAIVVVTIDGNDYTATNNGDGTWTLADNIVALLAEGNYTATVTATDAVGNVATDTSAVVIDTSIDENNNGQTVTFDSISNDSGVAGDFITSDSTLIFNGTVDLGDNTTLTVTVDGTSYTFGTDPELTIDGSGNWSLDLTGTTLPAGTYAVVATVTDEAGNSASTASQNVVVQALDAINDGNTVDMGEPVVTVNPPETTSNVDVIGLAEATGGVDASASFTVSPNHVGEVLVEVDQIALVAVADAYIVEVYDESGQLVYQGVSADSQLADVGGLDIFDVTGDETISFTLAGLDAGNYSVVVRNDENLLEDLLDNDNSNDVNLQELGSAGVVLGPDNQAVVLDTIETTLNTGVLGIPIGTVGTQVRGVLEVLLDITTVIGAGQLVNLLTAPLDAIGLTGFLDDILSVIADALLSNTLTLLQDTDITTTLTEYTYTGDLVAQGNLIDGDISGVGADTILDGAQVTLVTNASGDSVAVPGTGTVTIQGNYGVLEIAADGTYTYTADGDRSAIGQDEVFNYTLSDGETSDIAALTITISGSDFPPVVAQTDNNDMELGAQTAIVNAPVTDSDFQVIGLAEGSPAAGSPEASTTLTVDAGFFGEVVVEVSQTALVAVADAYRVDIIDADGNVVATAMTPDNPLIGDVAGVNLIGVTGDDTLVAKFSGLPAGDYTVVVRNDESALETLFDQNSDGSITLTELGDGGVVLGEENQEVVLTAVEAALNGTNASVLNGLGLGTVVRNLILEPALSTADNIGAGDLVSTITTGLNLLGLGTLADTVLDAVAAALLSNTLTLLQSTDITSTLTEYAFEGSTTTSGNVIDAANTGDVADSIAEGGVVTQVTHTNGESVTVLGTGLSGITIEGDYGDLTIFEDGSYTYVANGVRDGLGNTDSFSYTISDGTNTSTANLNFNLSGQGVSADSARAELTYDFVSEAGPSDLDALSHGYLLGLGGSFIDTSSTFAVATDTTQDITLNVDNGSVLSLVSSLTVTVEKFENGAWEAYRVFPNSELISLLGIDGDTVLTVNGLTEGLYRLSMSGTTGVGVAGSISVDLTSTINYLDQFEVSGVQTATGNLFENDVLFGPTYDVTVSTDGTTFQDPTGGITLVGEYGTLQIDETGAYTYTPDNTQAVFGGTLTDTFTYRIEYPDGTVEQAEFNVFVTASGEGVPEVVTTTSSESVSASDSSGTVVTDEPTAPDTIDLTGQTIQTVELSAETRVIAPETEPTAPLMSPAPVESVPDIITLPEDGVSTADTTVGDGFGGGDTIDLSGTKLDTVDIGDPVSTTPETTAPEPVTSGTLPEDTITLPEEGDIVSGGPVTEVTVDVVDIDLPPEDLILPATEPTSADATGDSTSLSGTETVAGDTSKESGSDIGTATPTESDVLKTAIDKLPPTDI